MPDGYCATPHKDSALRVMKPVPGDIIEARQVPVTVPVVRFIPFMDVIFTVVWIADDDLVRGGFLIEQID